MQKTLLIGHLGKDPEMKYTPGGNLIRALIWAVAAGLNSTNTHR